MTILDEIIARTRRDLHARRRTCPERELRQEAEHMPLPPDFRARLSPEADGATRVIAELKKASPSKGRIREDFDVISLALELERHGAAALSVLTEPHHFQGSPEYLRSVAATVSIPVLRKDFIVDEYQLHEARAWGASAVLLIAAALSPQRFRALHQAARDLGLAVLSEIHNSEELEVVLDGGADIVGINSRDLKTFRTDLATVEALLGAIPENTVRVAESGIHDRADIVRLQQAGADAFLIGESLMRKPHPGRQLDTYTGRNAVT